MMRFTTTTKILIGVMLLATAASARGRELQYTATFDEVYPLSASGRLSLDNVNGDVSITVWDRDEVRIEATKAASSQELLDRLEIEVEASSSSVRVRTRYPSDSGHLWRNNGESRVEYSVTMPRTASLSGIDLVNGNLMVDGLEGEIEAESVNGTLELRDVTGPIDASTVNGTLEVWAHRIRPGTRVELESVNGGIDLHLPSGLGADVEAETVNGGIRNDFGLPVHKGKWVGSDMRGTIGGGGIDISLETVNGGIRLHAD